MQQKTFGQDRTKFISKIQIKLINEMTNIKEAICQVNFTATDG